MQTDAAVTVDQPSTFPREPLRATAAAQHPLAALVEAFCVAFERELGRESSGRLRADPGPPVVVERWRA